MDEIVPIILIPVKVMVIDNKNSEVQQQIQMNQHRHGVRGSEREQPIFLRYIKENQALLLILINLPLMIKVQSFQTHFNFFYSFVKMLVGFQTLILFDCLHTSHSLTLSQIIDTSYQRNSRAQNYYEKRNPHDTYNLIITLFPI